MRVRSAPFESPRVVALSQALAAVDAWNATYPVGTRVQVFPAGVNDAARAWETVTVSTAWVGPGPRGIVQLRSRGPDAEPVINALVNVRPLIGMTEQPAVGSTGTVLQVSLGNGKGVAV